MKLPCTAERNNRAPPPGQPSRTATLVAVAGPEGEGPEPHAWSPGADCPSRTRPSATGLSFRTGSLDGTACPAFSRKYV
eukprot:7280636-Alexandrium_andersonii.AAC.1